jgi:hypothetical protein
MSRSGRSRLRGADFECPIFIICRDRLTPLRQLVEWLELSGYQRIILVDNDSIYPPLIEYYESLPHEKILLGTNLGHRAVWEAGLLGSHADRRPYVVTDCDVVPDESCPPDVVGRLGHSLSRFPGYIKAGVGLRIDDLPPENPHTDRIRAWEGQFWQRRIGRHLFHANVDTTFALYRAGTPYRVSPALRTGPPYVARHTPWYADPDNLTAEEQFYRNRADASVTTWNMATLSERVAGPLADLRPLTLWDRARWLAHKSFRLERQRRLGNP